MTSSSRLARRTKDRALASVEALWAMGFSVAGRLSRLKAEPWSSPGGQRVLVVAPHPDDEVAGCAGTLLRHRQTGDAVCLVCVTDGRRSRAMGLRPEDMACWRRLETEASARVLGIGRLEWLGLPEGEWSEGQLEPALGLILQQFSPHVVYAPSRVDFHPEHWKVAYALSLLLLDAGMQPTVRVYQVHVPLTAILTNRMSDVSGLTAEMTAAIDAYVTQSNSLVRTIRQRRYAARYYGIKQQAEEFWQMSSRQYRLLHSEPVDRWPVPAFRGIRHRSMSDPWAYVQGTPERRRLARLVMSHEP